MPEPVQIAILAWGSLVWDPKDLHIAGDWHKGGPSLPIELSRLSTKRGYLTYVIDERHERRVPTRYAISRYVELEDAIADLAGREGCAAHSIGFVEAGEHGRHRSRTQACWDIQKWIHVKRLGAAIWTDLPPAFPKEFTVDAVVALFKELALKLPVREFEEAKKYARQAPEEVDTDFRRRLEAERLLAAAPADSNPKS